MVKLCSYLLLYSIKITLLSLTVLRNTFQIDRNLNVQSKTLKHLEENVQTWLYDLGLENNF